MHLLDRVVGRIPGRVFQAVLPGGIQLGPTGPLALLLAFQTRTQIVDSFLHLGLRKNAGCLLLQIVSDPLRLDQVRGLEQVVQHLHALSHVNRVLMQQEGGPNQRTGQDDANGRPGGDQPGFANHGPIDRPDPLDDAGIEIGRHFTIILVCQLAQPDQLVAIGASHFHRGRELGEDRLVFLFLRLAHVLFVEPVDRRASEVEETIAGGELCHLLQFVKAVAECAARWTIERRKGFAQILDDVFQFSARLLGPEPSTGIGCLADEGL